MNKKEYFANIQALASDVIASAFYEIAESPDSDIEVITSDLAWQAIYLHEWMQDYESARRILRYTMNPDAWKQDPAQLEDQDGTPLPAGQRTKIKAYLSMLSDLNCEIARQVAMFE